MKHLKIAYSFDVQYYFVDSDREIVPVEQTDFTDVAVAVLSDQDYDYIDTIDATGFGIPIMVIMPSGEKLPSHYLDKVDMVLSEEMVNKSRCIETAERLASNYEQTVLPPFFGEPVRLPGPSGWRLFQEASGRPVSVRFLWFSYFSVRHL